MKFDAINTILKPKMQPSATGSSDVSQLRKYWVRFETAFYSIDKNLQFALMLSLLGATLEIDLHIDPRISLGPFYLLPILLSAWFMGQKATYLFVALSSFARVYSYSEALSSDTPFLFGYNLLLNVAVYLTIAILVLRVRHLTNRLAIHSSHLQNHIKHIQLKRRLDATIRRALPDEADEIARLTIATANDGQYSEEAPTTVEQQALSMSFRQSIASGLGVRDLWVGGKATVPVEFWVSVIDGNIAGFMMILGIDGRKASDRELHLVVVPEIYRGLGIGSTIVDFFCNHYKDRCLFVSCMPRSIMMAMVGSRKFRRYAVSSNGHILMKRAA